MGWGGKAGAYQGGWRALYAPLALVTHASRGHHMCLRRGVGGSRLWARAALRLGCPSRAPEAAASMRQPKRFGSRSPHVLPAARVVLVGAHKTIQAGGRCRAGASRAWQLLPSAGALGCWRGPGRRRVPSWVRLPRQTMVLRCPHLRAADAGALAGARNVASGGRLATQEARLCRLRRQHGRRITAQPAQVPHLQRECGTRA